MSVTPTPTDTADDFDIYGDLPEEICLTQKEKPINEHNIDMKLRLFKVQSELEESQRLNEKLKAVNLDLMSNISILYKTASSEIKRKDDKIAELHRELDNLTFRRSNRKQNGTQPFVSGRNVASNASLSLELQHSTHQSLISPNERSDKLEVDVLKQNLDSTHPSESKFTPVIDVDVLKANIQQSIRNCTASRRHEEQKVVDTPPTTNPQKGIETKKNLDHVSSSPIEKKKQLVPENKTQSPIKTIPKKRKIPEFSIVSDESPPVSSENALVVVNAKESDKIKEVKAPLKKSVFERLGKKINQKNENKEVGQEDESSNPCFNLSSRIPIQYVKKSENLVISTQLNTKTENNSKLHVTAPSELPSEALVSSTALESEKSTLFSKAAQKTDSNDSCTIQKIQLKLENVSPLKNNLSVPCKSDNNCSTFPNSKYGSDRLIEETSDKLPSETNPSNETVPGQSQNPFKNVEETKTSIIECSYEAQTTVHKGMSLTVELAAKSPKEFQILSRPAKEQEDGPEVPTPFYPPLPSHAPQPLPPLPLTSPPPTPIKSQTAPCVLNECTKLVGSQPEISHEQSTVHSSENTSKLRWSNENLLVQCPFKPRRRAKSVVLSPVEPTVVDNSSTKQDTNTKLASSSVSSKFTDHKFKKTPLNKTDSYENRLALESRSHYSQRSVCSSRHLSTVKSFPHMPERRSPSELLSGRSGRIERLSHQDKIRVRLRDRRSRSLSPQRRKSKQDCYRTKNERDSDTSRQRSQRVQAANHERHQEQRTKPVNIRSKQSIGNNLKSKSNTQRIADLFGESSPEPEEKSTMRKKTNIAIEHQAKTVEQPVSSKNDTTLVLSKGSSPTIFTEKIVSESSKTNHKDSVVVIRHRQRSMIRLSNSDGSSVTTTVIVTKSPSCPVPSKEIQTSNVLSDNTKSGVEIVGRQSNNTLLKDVRRPLYFREQESRKRCISDDSVQDCDFSGESDESTAKADSDETWVPGRVTKPKSVKRKRVVV